ncbi:MAG: hypothetical protein ACI927_001580, partial [Oceanospirillaceae bacterium]
MINLTTMPNFGGLEGLALCFIHKVIHRFCGYVLTSNKRLTGR